MILGRNAKQSRKYIKLGFSLVEMLITLTVVSVILSAFVPVISQKATPSVKTTNSDAGIAYYYGEPRSQKDCTAMNPSLLFVTINITPAIVKITTIKTTNIISKIPWFLFKFNFII